MRRKNLTKYILIFVLMLGFFTGYTQVVTIQPAVASIGMLQSSQLWNISVINSSANNQLIKVNLIVIDRISGLEVLTGESMEVLVKPGATLLNGNLVAPVKYSPAGFFSNVSGREFIPVGQYTLCFALFVEVNKNLTPAGKECIPVDIEPMTPPFLNYPFNKAIISEKNPRFVWIPPTPTQLFSLLQYDFLLVEKQPEQTPEEAIQRNTPLMVVGNLITNSFGYNGVGMNALDTGKQYAWQVMAKNGAAYGVKSEVWSFRVEGETISHKGESDYYLTLGSSNERLPVFYSSQDQLHVRYINNYIQGKNFNVIISDNKGKVVLNKKINIFPGDNFFSIKLTGKFLDNIIYNVRLESESAPIAYGQLIKVKNN